MIKTLTLKPLFITAIAFSAVSALPLSAAAQDSYEGIYANIGISQLSADLDLSDLNLESNRVDLGQENVKALLVNGRLGYRVNRNLAIEGDIGFGLSGDNFQRTIPVDINPLGVVNVDADVDLDVKSYFGIFARGILPVNEKFDLFARAGYGTAKAEAMATGRTTLLPGFSATASESQSSNGFAYGVGAEYHINARHGIRIDYSSIGNDASFIAAAYTAKF